MAIDKNSKAYQGLLAKGYTDEQITQMHGAVAGGQTTQQAVANTTPVNTPKYENQGSGNYVYNEATGYYENTTPKTPTATPSPSNTETSTPTVQETQKTEVETAGSTVPEIKQEGELKPLSQDYYNQTSDEAQSKIINNLNNYRQTNPEYFRDYESFKKNFSYDARNDEQKQTLDSWYGGYQKGMELAGIPTTDLYTQYKDGQVSMNELENLRVYDPTKYAELQAQINKGNIIAAYDDDKGVDTTGMNLQDMAYNAAMQMFTKFMSGDSSSGASQYFRDYEEKMESPEMLALSDQCTEVQEQMENIQSDLDSIKKQVEAEYEGTGATRSKINAIIADRSYDLQLQLRTLNSEYNKYATQYNNRMQQYQNEFSMQLQEYQINQQARNQQMQELGFALDLMNFETNDQRQQREWDYWVKQQEYTNGNINSKDYATRHKAALKSVENLLAQYPGIPTQRSAEQMADDILKAIDNGSNLGAELTKINKFMQEKPEYKYMYNNTFGGSQGFGQTISIGGTDYVEYDGKLYTADEFNKKFGGGSKANYTVVSPDVLKTYSDGRAGTFGSFMAKSQNNDGNYVGQCGKFVNNYLQEIGAGRPFGNETIDVRKTWINSDEGKVGTVAVFDYNHLSSDKKNHGHVAIVISRPDKNGDFWVKDANFDTKNPGVIMTRKVNLKDASLKGFIDPSLDQNGNRVSAGTSATLTSNSNGTTTNTTTNTTKTTITDSDIISFNDKTLNRKLSDEDRQRIANARNKVYSDPNASIEDILRFSQGGDSVTDTTVQSFDKYGQALTSLGQLTDLLEDTSTGPILGALRSKNPYDKKAREIETAIAGLLPTLARGVYGEVGVLTDKDIEHYSKTVPNLKSTSDVNEAVLAMSLDMLASGYKRKLQNQAALGKDVSGMAGVYYQIVNESNRIKKKIGIDTGTSDTESTPQTTNFYKQYAKTAPGVGKRRPFGNNNQGNIQLSNGQSFNWNS